MNRLLRKLTAVVSAAAVAIAGVNFGGIDGLTAAAETVGDFTVTGGTLGTDYTYENNVLTIKTDTPITISGTTTTDTIVVAKDTDANITLDGVNIDVSSLYRYSAFKIVDNSMGNVTITLADGSDNELKSGTYRAGLQKMTTWDVAGGKLIIQGGAKGTGSLTAIGGHCGAGIGGGYGLPTSNIEISGGVVTAQGGYRAAGIGGGGSEGTEYFDGHAKEIEGGDASNIFITGGSVKAVEGGNANAIGGGNGKGAVTPTLADGTTGVYLYEIDAESKPVIYIDGKPVAPHGDGKVYAYLNSEDTHLVRIGNNYYNLAYNSPSFDKTANTDGIGTDLVISSTTPGVSLVYGTDYTYPASTGVLTILSGKAITIKNASEGSTTDRIEVKGGVSADITLAGVNISSTNNAAFKIMDISTGNVTITLADGTENKLVSADGYAGLQKNGAYSDTPGTLTIKGGANGTGKLIASGGELGAGIGGGNQYSASNITITGGTVTANGGDCGASIGGGAGGSGSDIIITGGSVNATGENAIGGGVTKPAVIPTLNDTNKTPVYLLTIANPTSAAVYIDGNLYTPSNHTAADANDTNLYAYLTGTDHTVTIGTGDSAVTTKYKFYDGEFLPVPKASDFFFAEPNNLDYTGTAKQATVVWKNSITGGGTITAVKYYNAAGEEVTQGADFVPGTYTVEIEVAKGDKYAEATLSDDDWTFTITKGDLTRSGTGVASGTYGDTLGELVINGMFVDFDGTAVAGNWEIKSSETQDADYVPSVGDTAKYTATFTPNVNPTYYNTLTAEVSLDIAKANAPTIADIPVSYNWGATGEKTVTVSGLPVGMGTVGTAVIEIADDNGIIKANSAVYGQGKLRFTLNTNTAEKIGKTATIKATIPSQNYKDITFNVIVSITAKQDQTAPAQSDFSLSVDLQDNKTYTATITTDLVGVQYSFDGTNWNDTNTLTGIGCAETVTGYIRYAETDVYNASPSVYKSETTEHK